MKSLTLIIACVFWCSLAVAQPSHPWADEPYLGLAVRDTEHGAVAGWVYPGPLGGLSFTSSSGIQRGDNLVSINGTPIDSRDQFTELIKSLAPGDRITITYRRSPQADMNATATRPTAGRRSGSRGATHTTTTARA